MKGFFVQNVACKDMVELNFAFVSQTDVEHARVNDTSKTRPSCHGTWCLVAVTPGLGFSVTQPLSHSHIQLYVNLMYTTLAVSGTTNAKHFACFFLPE